MINILIASNIALIVTLLYTCITLAHRKGGVVHRDYMDHMKDNRER